MGAMHSMELAGSDGLDLETQIGIQLRSNHYPPVPLSMVPVCIEAINKANDNEWNWLIDLPEGVTWRGETYAPALAIIEGHHLEPWLQDDEEEMYWEAS